MKISVILAVFLFESFVSAGLSPTPVKRSSQLDKSNVERNADRLRRGLPPLPPFRRGDRPPPRPSQQPCVPLSSPSGHIEVIKADGTIAGYISSEFDQQHAYTLTTSKSSALQVNLPSTSPFSAPFNILAVNGQDIRHPYLGAVGGANGYRFGQSQRGSAYLAGTGASPANSPPSSRGGTSMQSIGYNAPGESQIWSMDCKTREISAQWTNADSTQPKTTIFYDPADKCLGLTFDGTLNVDPQAAQSVTFNFVPL
ncbi:hypothetical protein C8R45DRAFT_1218931 [Mycena sanguinolenta]|nr:hypothetical protein C8R45DRAFT_1218931 [Mycena sanguinolenta]